MSAVGDFISASVSRVDVTSNLWNTSIKDPLAPGDPNAPPPFIMRLLQPKVMVYDADGQLVFSYAPAGEPSSFPWLALAVVVAGVGTVVGIGLVARAL